MKKQIDNAISYIKELDIDGCITGSIYLDYFEGQDIDIFCYSESSFTKLLYTLHFNPDFLILEDIEQWKFDEWTNKDYKKSIKKLGLVTIKFKYNTCIDINIIYKESCKNIFDVLCTFDMNIVCKGFDLKTKQYLDISNYNHDKKAIPNIWNKSFYDINIWNISRILRQFVRVVKYYKRGYDTDAVCEFYIKLLEEQLSKKSIFKSEIVKNKMEEQEKNIPVIIEMLKFWLKEHKIEDKELELLNEKINKI